MTIKERWNVFRIFFGKLRHSGVALLLLLVLIFTLGPALVNYYGNLGLKDNGTVLNFFFGWFIGSLYVLTIGIIVAVVWALLFFFHRLLYYFIQECKLNWQRAKEEHQALTQPTPLPTPLTTTGRILPPTPSPVSTPTIKK